jgi:hypothetical protein
MTTQLTQDQLLAMIQQLKTENATLKAQPVKKLSFKVSEKGAVSVYGLSARFPTTLYASQWERLLAASDEITAFIAANAALVARKA